MAQSHREAMRRLFELAEQQQGFFTTKQAKAAGFAENTHPYHVQAGNWTREYRGVYRLALFPPTDRPDLALWALWSKNRLEVVEGVYSHETALVLHELSDVNPARIHMTVPPSFRRNSAIPAILVLHKADIPKGDIQQAQGYRYTSPLRTILDIIAGQRMQKGLIHQAIRQAAGRGLITRHDIQRTPMDADSRKLIEEALRQAA